jgi:hypothetical protein
MPRRAPVFVLAIACLTFAPPADAKPGPAPKTTVRASASRAGAAKPAVNPSGLGQRTAGLSYLAVPASAFLPMALVAGDPPPGWEPQTMRFTAGVATVSLPEGARIRELTCIGQWVPAKNEGKSAMLRAQPLTGGTAEVVARAKVIGGTGVRRIESSADHHVSNFDHAYSIELVFNSAPTVHGCRIGYEPPV